MSPLVLAVLRGLPVVTRMLYESGSCSYSELLRLRTKLPQMIRGESWKGYSVRRIFPPRVTSSELKHRSKSVKSSARYLMKVCTTPRSLKSSCRLVISRCVKVRRQRHRDAVYAQLPLSQEMRNYVMFSDLTDPDYGKDEIEGDEEDSERYYTLRKKFFL